MSGRGWTSRENAVLRRDYRRVPTEQIARKLGRGVSSVYLHARELGLSQKRPVYRGLDTFIRRYHRMGWSDSEIAAEWSKRRTPITRETLRHYRDRLGLPHNAYSQHRRRRVAERTRKQCRAAGVKSLAEVRVLAFREFARRQGWPSDLRPRHVQIMKLLYELGPMTRRQLCDAMGMVWRGTRRSLKSNDPEGSYLGHLQARGLVVRLGRVPYDKGKGRTVYVYACAPHVKRSVSCRGKMG